MTRWPRWGGRWTHSAVLIAGLASGCVSLAPPSYRVTIPVLKAPPHEAPCTLIRDDGSRLVSRCVTVTRDDWEALVREVKAACLANGQPRSECLPGEPP